MWLFKELKFLESVLWLLATADVPSSLIFVTLMMVAIRFSKMLVLTRATWHNFLEDGILLIEICIEVIIFLSSEFQHNIKWNISLLWVI
jgi:hypothetical protein